MEVLRSEEYNLTSGKHNKPAKIFIKFLKYLCIKLPQKDRQFNLYKGKPVLRKSNVLKLYIKDPFIKFINYGYVVNVLNLPPDLTKEERI